VTLRQIASHSQDHGYNLKLVTCCNSSKLVSPLPINTLNFEPIREVGVPGYETQKIGFPSLLNLMRQFIEEQPDIVIISTPGPLGLGAMLCAKIMDIPVKAIYHTDFAEQVMRMSNEPSLANVIDLMVNNFYKQADQIFAPSQFYIDKLSNSGLDRNKLAIFPRGIDLNLYKPKQQENASNMSLIRRYQLQGSFTLLFAGRISEDKNLSLLSKIIERANLDNPGTYNLIIAGEGPDLPGIKKDLARQNNVLFTGRLSSEELVAWYQDSDLLIFPSHTDTFGMVVLEAQACGLPCLVTATGGPKEIIIPNVTGHVIHQDRATDWLAIISQYRRLKETQSSEWDKLKFSCSEHVNRQNNWQPVFDAVLGDRCLFANRDSTNHSHSESVLDNAA